MECEQACIWAGLAPDGELSEFEESCLHTHLATCAPCSTFAAEVERAAMLLRSAELARPSQSVVLRRSPAHRRLIARSRPVAAAAAVALMALGVASRAPLPVEERSSPLRATVPAAPSDQQEMQALRERRELLRAPAGPGIMPIVTPYPV